MKIIVINGQGGVGKDTFVGYCGYEDMGIYNFSMVDEIKKIALYVGWTGRKSSKDRKFLSDLKDLTSEYSDFPFKSVVNKINETLKDNRYRHKRDQDLIFFIHAREPKDIMRWVKDYGAKTLLIRREDIEGSYGNHADDSVFDIDYDYIIQNNKGLINLKEEAESFINMIREEDWSCAGPGLYDQYYTWSDVRLP